MTEKYLITGAAGQLGHALQLALGGEEGNAMPRAREALDITDTETLKTRVASMRPDAVINCAAYTNVPQAERDREKCWRVNAMGVANLASVCADNDIPLFHISTDFVFGQDFTRCAIRKKATKNKKPVFDTAAQAREQAAYTEECPVGPVGYYAQSKVAGEHAILAKASQKPNFNYYIIRTAGLYERPWREINNFPFKIARRLFKTREAARVVADVHTNICSVDSLVQAIVWMLRNRDEWSTEVGPVVAPGIYNITNRGQASWYDVAAYVARRCIPGASVIPITRKDYASQMGMAESASPLFTCLDLDKYHTMSEVVMPEWQEPLDRWCHLAKKYFA